MSSVKTAISVDESLFTAAERAAEDMHISRSQLFSRALREFLQRYEGREITRKLNEVFAGGADEESEAFTRGAMANLARLTEDDKW